MRTGLRVQNAFAGSPQYPSLLRYGATQQSHSRFARTMGCLSFHRSIRIWSTIFHSGTTGRKAISGCSRIFGFSCVRPTYSCPPLIATRGRLSLGLASPFVCRLRIRLVCGLVLLHLTVRLPWLDCPAFGLWSRDAAGLPVATSARFVFLLEAPPLPCLLLCYQNVPPGLSTESAFGQWKNYATSTAMIEMFLKNSFIDQTQVLRTEVWYTLFRRESWACLQLGISSWNDDFHGS
jgi:hypothetical protein